MQRESTSFANSKTKKLSRARQLVHESCNGRKKNTSISHYRVSYEVYTSERTAKNTLVCPLLLPLIVCTLATGFSLVRLVLATIRQTRFFGFGRLDADVRGNLPSRCHVHQRPRTATRHEYSGSGGWGLELQKINSFRCVRSPFPLEVKHKRAGHVRQKKHQQRSCSSVQLLPRPQVPLGTYCSSARTKQIGETARAGRHSVER